MTIHLASRSVAPPWQLTVALAVALAAAGVIHCLLTPEHMEVSVVFGAGFLAAGVGQFGMAAMAVLRPSRLVYAAIIAMTLGLTALYAYNVVLGLPLQEPAVIAAGTDELTSDRAHRHEPEPRAEGPALSDGAEHHEAGLVIGTGEPIDPYGAMTQLAQLSAAALAVTLLVRRTPATV